MNVMSLRMIATLTIVALALVAAAVPGVQAGPAPLLQTTQSWDGGTFDYPEGQPEVTSVILKIEEGQQAPFHCHPVPTLGYVLKGTVQVETANGQSTVIEQGESVVEVMRTLHRGKALGGPVEILVFYAGASGIPTTLLPDDAAAAELCEL